MKKRVLAGLLAAMMMVSVMSATAFAAELEVPEEPELHCVTIDVADLLTTGTNMAKTVTPSLILGGYQSGWSTEVRANFTIPSNATVVSVKVTPGDAVAGGPATSVIYVSKFRVTAPNGTSAEVGYKNSGAETSAFNGILGRGYWTLSMYGQNLGPDYNTIKLNNTTLTIYYEV